MFYAAQVLHLIRALKAATVESDLVKFALT